MRAMKARSSRWTSSSVRVRSRASRGVRIYLTLNILVKPHELADALSLLGEAIDRGIDAAIVQDVGLVRLIRDRVPGIRDSRVHADDRARRERRRRDARARYRPRRARAREHAGRHPADPERRAGPWSRDVRAWRAMHLVLRPVLHVGDDLRAQRESRLVRAVVSQGLRAGRHDHRRRARSWLPDLGEGSRRARSAGRAGGGGHRLPQGRRPKEEARIRRDRHAADTASCSIGSSEGNAAPPSFEEVQPLVQIFSRGYTAGMLWRTRRARLHHAHAARQSRRRDRCRDRARGQRAADRRRRSRLPWPTGSGSSHRPAARARRWASRSRPCEPSTRTAETLVRQSPRARRVPSGWTVLRTSHAALLERARASFADLPAPARTRRTRIDLRLFGSAGAPTEDWSPQPTASRSSVRGEIPLSPARAHALDVARLREQLGRLGETPFALGDLRHRRPGAPACSFP